MRKLILFAAVLAGCSSHPEIAKELPPTRAVDQCMRAELFSQCVATLPDHARVGRAYAACENIAQRQSVRDREAIATECR